MVYLVFQITVNLSSKGNYRQWSAPPNQFGWASYKKKTVERSVVLSSGFMFDPHLCSTAPRYANNNKHFKFKIILFAFGTQHVLMCPCLRWESITSTSVIFIRHKITFQFFCLQKDKFIQSRLSCDSLQGSMCILDVNLTSFFPHGDTLKTVY